MSNLKILMTGITSIHGWPIFEKLRKMGDAEILGIRPPKMRMPCGPDTLGLCITDKDSFLKIKKQFKPQVIIHAAGVCDLDVCEERPSWAHSLNTIGSKVIADVFGIDTYVIYLSSDLVFSGNNPTDGGYKESSIPDPISVAGKTIALAEEQIARCNKWCIIRLGLPIGKSITGDKGAVDFIDSRLKRLLPLTLFYDELRSCVGCNDICEIIYQVMVMQCEGIFHLGGPTPFSLYDVGEWVRKNGKYRADILKGISRFEEKSGPPRIGNVAIDSSKIQLLLKYRISNPIDCD